MSTLASGKAIAGLIVNIFIPGLGSLIGGKTKHGIIQLIIYILGIVLAFGGAAGVLGGNSGLAFLTIIGWLATIVVWVWALVTGILMVTSK